MSPDTEKRVQELEKRVRELEVEKRFYIVDITHKENLHRKKHEQPYLVCDNEQPHREFTIAKFRFENDAKEFLMARRVRYIETGE
jgi:hypothetical protein